MQEKNKNDRKYLKISEFIEYITTDKEVSKYYYYKTGEEKYKNEYFYNKYLIKLIKIELNKRPLLKQVIECGVYNTETNIPVRTLYNRLKREYDGFIRIIYKTEDLLYDKYITRSNNENNQTTKFEGMERTLFVC